MRSICIDHIFQEDLLHMHRCILRGTDGLSVSRNFQRRSSSLKRCSMTTRRGVSAPVDVLGIKHVFPGDLLLAPANHRPLSAHHAKLWHCDVHQHIALHVRIHVLHSIQACFNTKLFHHTCLQSHELPCLQANIIIVGRCLMLHESVDSLKGTTEAHASTS